RHGRRSARHPGAARPRLALHHPALHPRLFRAPAADLRGRAPARPQETLAAAAEGDFVPVSLLRLPRRREHARRLAATASYERSRRFLAMANWPSRKSSMLVPSAASCWGTNERRVRPGKVFSSRKTGPDREAITSV